MKEDNFLETVNHLKVLLEKDRLPTFFEELQKIALSYNISNEIKKSFSLLLADYNHHYNQFIKGILGDNWSNKKSEINDRALGLLDQLKKDSNLNTIFQIINKEPISNPVVKPEDFRSLIFDMEVRFEDKIQKLEKVINQYQKELKGFKNFKESIENQFEKYKLNFAPHLQHLKQIMLSSDSVSTSEILRNKLKEYLKLYQYFSPFLKSPMQYLDFIAFGIASFYKKELQEAEFFFREAIKINKDDYLAYVRLAGILFHQNKLNDVIPLLNKAMELNPNYPATHYNIGCYYLGKEEYEISKRYLTQAIFLKGDYIKAYNNLALTYIETKDYNLAISTFDKVLEIDLYYSFAYYNKACIFSMQRKVAETLLNLERSISLDENCLLKARDDSYFKWLHNNQHYKKLIL